MKLFSWIDLKKTWGKTGRALSHQIALFCSSFWWKLISWKKNYFFCNNNLHIFRFLKGNPFLIPPCWQHNICMHIPSFTRPFIIFLFKLYPFLSQFFFIQFIHFHKSQHRGRPNNITHTLKNIYFLQRNSDEKTFFCSIFEMYEKVI